jgi:hypothetical protein
VVFDAGGRETSDDARRRSVSRERAVAGGEPKAMSAMTVAKQVFGPGGAD